MANIVVFSLNRVYKLETSTKIHTVEIVDLHKGVIRPGLGAKIRHGWHRIFEQNGLQKSKPAPKQFIQGSELLRRMDPLPASQLRELLIPSHDATKPWTLMLLRSGGCAG